VSALREVQICPYPSLNIQSDIVSVSECLNRIFMMSTFNYILSDMVDIISIQIQI